MLKPPSKIITITGPESSGKTTLASSLAQTLNGWLLQELSRTYLTELARPYDEQDIIEIGRKHLEKKRLALKLKNPYIICDTGFLVLKIWMEYKYGKAAPSIEAQFLQDEVDLYLLCRPDIPWEWDPLRENPHDRAQLFDLYEAALITANKPYIIIEGASSQARTNSALGAIQQID